jgi:hypothetical protein
MTWEKDVWQANTLEAFRAPQGIIYVREGQFMCFSIGTTTTHSLRLALIAALSYPGAK